MWFVFFGCPYGSVVNRGYGAGILHSPHAVEAVLRAAERFPEIVFSVKMRLPDSPEMLSVLSSFHLRHIVLHPRTAEQQYSGVPDRKAFEKFRNDSSKPGKFAFSG